VILSAKLYTKYKDDFSASNKEKADETLFEAYRIYQFHRQPK